MGILSGVTPFGLLLMAAIKRAGLSQAAFARKVGTVSSFVTHLLYGQRTAPLDRIDAWADALALEGQERTAFVRAAWLTHAPTQVSELVSDLERRVAALTAAMATLRADYLELLYELRQLRPGRSSDGRQVGEGQLQGGDVAGQERQP